MSKEEAIINKILSDANEKADAILKDAHDKASDLIAKANADGREKKRVAETEASLKIPELKRRSASVAELEVKKLALAARQEILGETFDKALEKLCALPNDEYLSIISAMIKAVAADGDVVVISSRDEKRITPAFIVKIAKEKGISLKLSSSFGDFKGGVILESSGCDKNMSFEVELASLRETLEPKVSSKLF
ncbi:MAG: V-type ATP synthase subunit E [Clostridia bacterium]|nr:V-type ATP synthase subunit E [Clostridia bacterium]